MPETRPDWLADVDGADALFDWFGYWPDFHDAEILRVDLDRTGRSTVSIKTWETTSGVNAQGYNIQRKHVVVHFLLRGISDLELTGFSVQNVISGLEISRSQDGFSLELGPCYGLAGSLTAERLWIQIQPTDETEG